MRVVILGYAYRFVVARFLSCKQLNKCTKIDIYNDIIVYNLQTKPGRFWCWFYTFNESWFIIPWPLTSIFDL